MNLSPSLFADKIGVQRSGVSHILSGRNKPSLDFIIKILTAFPQVDADWLLFGRGEMIHKDETAEPVAHPPEMPDNEIIPGSEPAERVKASQASIPTPGYSSVILKVTKVVLCYDDHTFSEYSPRQAE